MKSMKKLLALALVLVMLTALGVTALAAGTGSITIKPPADIDTTVDITYTIYKVFNADGNGTNISYTLVDGKTEAPAGFTVDAAGNVTYAGGTSVTELTEADIAAIAAYVKNDTPVATATSSGGANAVAQNLPNGYYYITTTTGTVVTIDSTNPNAEVDDKNKVPGVDKKITGAVSYDEDGKKALAEVGTQVTYTAEITVGKGQLGYVFKDTMSAGLEYVADSLTVSDMTAGTDYTLSVSGQNITVTFKDDSIKSLAEGAVIKVTYKATVTSAALQDNPAKNTATISYGNNSQYTSKPSETEVYNAQISVLKQDEKQTALPGAGFVLKNADGKYYKLGTDGKTIAWADSIDDADEHVSDADGKVAPFTGLANGTYTLEEKTVPTGYNKAADTEVTIAEHDYSEGNLKQEKTIENKAGTVLPSTGSIGTTLFYVFGTLLVLGAGVVLVTKRRVQE